jgi:hypothetical protein
MHCLHLQGQKITLTCCLFLACSAQSSALKIVAVHSSETSEDSTRLHDITSHKMVTAVTTSNFTRGFKILVLTIPNEADMCGGGGLSPDCEQSGCYIAIPPSTSLVNRASPEGSTSQKTPATCPFRMICPRKVVQSRDVVPTKE